MNNPTVFFDLGDTLGEAIVSSPPVRLLEFHTFPYVNGVLSRLLERGVQLGIISNTGEETGDRMAAVLGRTELPAFFSPDLCIYSADVGLTKADTRIFALAAERAGVSATECVFVGEDSSERVTASRAGMGICPHPLLVEAVLAGEQLHFVRIARADDNIELSDIAGVVALRISGPGGRLIEAIAATSAIAALESRGVEVVRLGAPDLPLDHDLFLIRDIDPSAVTRDRERVLLHSEDGIVVAWPAGTAIGELHRPGMRHGHTVKLTPSPSLLTGRTTRAPAAFAPPVAAALPDAVVCALSDIDPQSVATTVAWLSGALPHTDGMTFTSRHIAHPDNERAVAALAAELARIGGAEVLVSLHKFSHRGRELFNVVADIAGPGAGVVLVTAHLDSTADFDADFQEHTDAAPGADDDASGVAAALEVVRAVVGLARNGMRPAATLRIVLFNAEEDGLVGSQAYARMERARGTDIRGVLQMDMVGFNAVPPRSWEIHAGFAPDPGIEGQSFGIAALIEAAQPVVSPNLDPPQIYRTRGAIADPADGRSDHTPFQALGYPGVVICEDYFAGPTPSDPPKDTNPNYHLPSDTVIDAAFAADIARTVAAAAWQLAGSSLQANS